MLLPPGDPGLTRRVKLAGPTWTVQEKRGRKIFGRGVWAPQATVERIHAELATERATPEYAKRKAADARRRGEAQDRVRRRLRRRCAVVPAIPWAICRRRERSWRKR